MDDVARQRLTRVAQWVAIAHIFVLFVSPFSVRAHFAEYWFVVIDTMVSAVFLLDLVFRKEKHGIGVTFMDIWSATPFFLILGPSPLALVLNVGKLVSGLRAIGRLHYGKREIEVATGVKIAVLFVTLILYFSTLIVLIEGGQNESFNSFGGGLWWAVVTITTTGYGDVTPETPLGRVAATLLMFMGIGVSSAIGAVFVSYLLRPTEDKILKKETEVEKEVAEAVAVDREMLLLLRSVDKRLSKLERARKLKK